MKKIILSGIALLFTLMLHAQQDALFSHYSFNTIAVNPAYAGSRNALTITGLHRSQWVGFKGAPSSQTVNVHSPIKSENIGMGLSLSNDQIGSASNQGIFIDLAYQLKVGDGKLCFGLKGGFNLYTNQVTALWVQDVTDSPFLSNTQRLFAPNFGAGIYYHSKRFFAGFSTPSLLNSQMANGVSGARKESHYYLISGGHFKMGSNTNLAFHPTIYLKYVAGAYPQVDITSLFYFRDKIWAGPMYRMGDALGVLAGLNITNQFALSYAFDWSFGNKTGTYNSGSHELLLRYDFVFRSKKYFKSPRYF
jgi:type IX secretion system PorP/SprF family membrane protein